MHNINIQWNSLKRPPHERPLLIYDHVFLEPNEYFSLYLTPRERPLLIYDHIICAIREVVLRSFTLFINDYLMRDHSLFTTTFSGTKWVFFCLFDLLLNFMVYIIYIMCWSIENVSQRPKVNHFFYSIVNTLG